MAEHCEHWMEGSDECHRCGDFPMMRRLAKMVGFQREPDPECSGATDPCPAEHGTWRKGLSTQPTGLQP